MSRSRDKNRCYSLFESLAFSKSPIGVSACNVERRAAVSLHGSSRIDLAADIGFANHRYSGCFDRNADIDEPGDGLVIKTGARTHRTMPGAITEIFDKSLI